MDTVRIAVIGAGVIGLSTAVCISQLVPRCSVTVISDQFTPNTTSNVAAGMLIPHTYPDTPVPTQKQWFTETFRHLSAIAESAEAADAGVHLVSGLKECGGLLLTRRIEDLWELQPSFDIVVNCSGLGSRQLVGDSMISPVRGQVLQAQAPWVKHFIRDGSGLTYVYPGTSYVTLGGTRHKGDWNLSPDAELSREIFSRCCALEPSLRRASNIKEEVGLRPSRPEVRLQKEMLARGGQRLPVVHNYGHGSGGVSVHWGSALEATRLVMEWIHTLRTPATVSKL
ncbi:D-aspartate oxidase isoform X2 [Peromyscus californicus insignis]|uniref:D-aspartate oxidase isoform X2 n=1 Tax=Peromyscus californicus insignis TaxID=564181 RepID=UPI0022A7F892|nr:D-aspartate oxidase isoform X2 [Peromyscus californicus insignis]